jgi:hypothetical protein
MGENEGKFLAGCSQGTGKDQRSRSLGLVHQRTEVEGMNSSALSRDRALGEPAIGSVLASFGEMMGQGDQRAHTSKPHTIFDRNGAWKSDDGARSNTATDVSAQQAMAAATDELERLRAAVKLTIDELERARGSVQPPLPALPLNRGAFRIS